MTAIIATSTCVVIIAGLMIAGIKMKLPPPDPDWREHLPPPAPQPTGGWLVLRYGPLVAWPLIFAVALILRLAGAEDGVIRAFAVVVAVVMLARVGSAIAWAIHVQRDRRRRGWRPDSSE
jgi:hypothetical protein